MCSEENFYARQGMEGGNASVTDYPEVNPPKPGAAGTCLIGSALHIPYPAKPNPLKATLNLICAVGVPRL